MEARAAPAKPKLSLGRRLQRQTTKLFAWSHGASASSSSSSSFSPRGGTSSSSGSNHSNINSARVASHREGSSRTPAARSRRSRTEPREESASRAGGLSATARVVERPMERPVERPVAAQAAREDARSDEDGSTDTEEQSSQRADTGGGARPRIGEQGKVENRVRLLDVGYASVVGSQDHDNEDRLLLRSNEHFHLLSVMDGHGGALAASFVAERLFERLEAVYSLKGGFPADAEGDRALERMMQALDDEFCALARQESDLSGVCVLALVLFFDELETHSAHKLVLNLGDCRVILREAVDAGAARSALGARVMALSTDHCASNRAEKIRICENGGYVRFGRVAGLLEPSRSIGDIDMKEPEMKDWVIATPEIRRRELAVGRSLLVLATDGVWGVLPNHKVMEVALEALAAPRARRRRGAKGAAENAVRAIVEAARLKGSVDDVSVIVVVV